MAKARLCVVGGGESNTCLGSATAGGQWSTVAGGFYNTVSGTMAVVRVFLVCFFVKPFYFRTRTGVEQSGGLSRRFGIRPFWRGAGFVVAVVVVVVAAAAVVVVVFAFASVVVVRCR